MAEPIITAHRILTNINHLTLTYVSTNTDTVNIFNSPGLKYYPSGAGGANDLLDEIETKINSRLTASSDSSGSVAVTFTSGAADYPSYALKIQHSGTSDPAHVISSITFLSDEIRSVDLGWAATVGAPDTVTLTAGAFTGSYQVARLFAPRDLLLMDDPEDIHDIVVAHVASGAGLLDTYGGRTMRRVMLSPSIPGVLIKSQGYMTGTALDTALRNQVQGLQVNDPNIGLDCFIRELRELANDSIPQLKWYPDDTDKSIVRNVSLLDPALYSGTSAWTGEPVSLSPYLYGMDFEYCEVS